MTRLAPITAVRLIKVLHKLGFGSEHQKGSHLFLRHADGRTTVVPVHKGEDIGRGLLRKILRDVQIEPDDFHKLL